VFRVLTSAAMLALTITAAQAGDAIVRFGDLNPANPRDAKVLANRVQQAASAACGPELTYEGPSNLFYPAFYHATQDSCVHRISESTMAKIQAVTGERPRFAQQ